MTEKERVPLAWSWGCLCPCGLLHQLVSNDWLGRGPNGKVGGKLHEIYLTDPDVVGLKRVALAARQPDVALKWALMQ